MSASTDIDEEQAAGDADPFLAQAQLPAPGLASEFFYFLRHNKKWWLTPILLILAVVGLIVSLGGTAAAPWIYTFF